jgi:AmiR/NasT family two-component response regulator
MSESQIADVLAAAAQTINAPVSLQETLDAIVRAASETVPGLNLVGISVARPGARMETLAASDPMVLAFDRMQYDLDEGPCVDAMRGRGTAVVEHAQNERRWPRYIPQAVAAGLRSQLGVGLGRNDRTLAGLNMYSTSSEILGPQAQHMAELFAAHAALALGSARQRDGLTTALGTRKIIGQAIGILMERYDIDEDQAFGFLARTSSEHNIKLRDVAQGLVDQGNARRGALD